MNNTLMQLALALGSSVIVSTLVKATLLLAFALALARGARRVRASVRHMILASAFAILLVLPAIVAVAPPITFPVGRPAPASPPVAWALAPITGRDVHDQVSGRHATDRRTPHAAVLFSILLQSAWAAGVVLVGASSAVALRRASRVRGTARCWVPGETVARRLAADAGITRCVAVGVSDAVGGPMTCGVIRPLIVLPADAPQWHARDIQRVFVHELEHIRRFDWPVQIAARLVCALYWFHPLVWAAQRRLELESERACDDAVLRESEGSAYAQQLVTLARRHTRRPLAAGLAMAARSDLSLRVAALLDDARARGRVGVARGLGIVGIAASVAMLLAPVRVSARQDSTQSLDKGRDARLAFDVASVRPSTSVSEEGFFSRQGSQLTATNYRLRNLILVAYRLQPFQLVDAPEWIDSARFDIVAKAPFDPQPSPPGAAPGQMELMLQTLLAERFNLRVHADNRDMPIFALVRARVDGPPGSGLRPAAFDCAPFINALGRGATPPAPPMRADGRPACGMMGGPGRFFAGGITMPMLASTLSAMVGRVVTDRTGLAGVFDADLEFSSAPLGGPPGASPPDGGAASDRPSIFTALEEQLGLRLEPARGPVRVLVVDRVERPSEN